MIHLNFKTIGTVLALVAASPALVACGEAPPSGDVESTGTLNAALLTAGADGATYQFLSGAELLISGGNYNDSFSLGGIETLLNIRLPVGTFNVQLRFPNGTPQLLRTIGGRTTTVDATWLDSQPVIVSITQGAVTSLVLHFRVAGLGDVSFDTGNLAVALDVQRSTTNQPAQFHEQGTYIHSSTLAGPSASAEAQAYYAMSGGTSFPHFFDFNIIGAWQQLDSDRLCTFTRLESFTAEGGDSGFSRAAAPLVNQIGALCVIDHGPLDELFVNASVLGPAPVDQQAFLPSNYQFFIGFTGEISDVYDGQTFEQSALETFTNFRGTFSHRIFDNALVETTLQSDGTVNGSIRLVP